MTFAGVLRSIDAANRRAIRNQQRYERLRERQYKLQAKLNELENARLQVEQFEETQEQLTSVHREDPTVIDWKKIAEEHEPTAPVNSHRWETQARRALAEYKPGMFEKLFRRVEKRKTELAKEIEVGIADDNAAFAKSVAEYESLKQRHDERVTLATAIINGSIEAYKDASDFINPLSDVIAAGAEVEVKFVDCHTVEVRLTVESETVVPAETKSLTKSGKLSVKVMPKTRFNELYQDYVCGSALRAAREFFAFLPVRLVVVHVLTEKMNTGLGVKEPTTVLSVAMPRQTLDRMNFAVADASDAMQNFIHRMGFKRSLGFSGIRPLEPHEYPSGESAIID